MLTRRQMIVSALTALAGGTWFKAAGAQTGHATGSHRKSAKKNIPYTSVVTPNGITSL